MRPDGNLIERLAAFDTATICNAIELFEVRHRDHGYTRGQISCAFPDMRPAVGLACTATFRSGSPHSNGDPYGCVEELCRQLEECPVPTIVAYEDLDHPPVGATFGEVMCGVYKSLGAVGLITSGAGRDLSQIRNLGFPVFFGSTIAAHAYCHAVEIGGTVIIGGLAIANLDLLHADANGITTIPPEVAMELPEVAAEYMRCESIVMDAFARGTTTAAELVARRREMIDGISRLRHRVSHRRST
jgi:4-hydroxy-4-methyl-2-oxoglutarate aldolase